MLVAVCTRIDNQMHSAKCTFLGYNKGYLAFIYNNKTMQLMEYLNFNEYFWDF